MSAEAMIQRFRQVQDSIDAEPEPIEVALENDRIAFTENDPAVKVGTKVANVIAAAIFVLMPAWVIAMIWQAQKLGWWKWLIVVLLAGKASGVLERRFGKIAGNIGYLALVGLMVYTVSNTSLLLSRLFLTLALMAFASAAVYRVSTMPTSKRAYFRIVPSRGELCIHRPMEESDPIPIEKIDYFLAYRPSETPTDTPVEGWPRGLFAVTIGGEVHRLTYGWSGNPADLEHTLKTLGHICQKSVFALDDLDRRTHHRDTSGFSVAESTDGSFVVTSANRDILSSEARAVYRPAASIA